MKFIKFENGNAERFLSNIIISTIKKSMKEISIPLDDRPQKVASDIDSTAFALPLRHSG